jgi:cell division protein FtsQ
MAEHNAAVNQSHEENAQRENKSMEFHQVMQRYIPILILNILFIVGLAYLISPLSKVNSITVVGNEAVYDQVIINESAVNSGESVIQTLMNRESSIQEIVNNLDQVAKADVELEGFNDIVINVDEYETVAYIAQNGAYLRVLENGQVLDDEYAVSIGNQPVLSNFEEGAALNLMIEQLSLIEKPILDLISEIEFVNNETNPLMIQVYMNNGNRVLASIPSFSEKMPYYPQMVKAVHSQKGVFDMESGVYFIPFVDEEGEDGEVDESERQVIEEFNG